MKTVERVKSLLGQVLQLGERTKGLSPETPLLGSLPELDSMAVATVIAALEDQFSIVVEDDEISADVFETVGTLSQFIDAKLAA